MRVKSQLDQYTTLTSFNKVRMQQEKENKNNKAMQKVMIVREEVEKKIEMVKEHIIEVSKSNSSIGACAKDKRELIEMIDKLTKEITHLKEDHR